MEIHAGIVMENIRHSVQAWRHMVRQKNGRPADRPTNKDRAKKTCCNSADQMFALCGSRDHFLTSWITRKNLIREENTKHM